MGDTSGLAREARDWLVEMVKINTTNPPGNEQAVAKYLAGILTKEGITPEILDVAPGRSALVARLRSSAVANPSKALLLVAHMDVVGVDRSKWSVDPFGGVIKDGLQDCGYRVLEAGSGAEGLGSVGTPSQRH